jgi:hypothetical protein
MYLVFTILSIVAVVLTGSFLLRVGLPLYREKKSVAVLALGAGFIAYFIAALVVRAIEVSGYNFISIPPIGRSEEMGRWLLIHTAVSTAYSFAPLAILLYLAILVRRDFAVPAATRSLFKESALMVGMAFLFAGLSLFQHV